MSEFLDGMTSGKDPAEEAPVAPAVVPVEAIREAVTPMIKQIVVELLQAAMADEGPSDAPPSGTQLDMMFEDAGREGSGDPIADATLRRVHEINERQAQKDLEARQNGAVPEMYDPNAPDGKPWTAPGVA